MKRAVPLLLLLACVLIALAAAVVVFHQRSDAHRVVLALIGAGVAVYAAVAP